MSFGLKWASWGFCLASILIMTMPGGTVVASDRHPVELNIDNIVRAKSALLIDAETGEVLYQRNIKEHLPPASTVKMLTALLVYELKGLNGSVVVAPEDRAEPSNVPLVPGETVSVHDLVYSLLLGSDNDSARALARYTGGTLDKFVAMMNSRAAMLGCRNSCFKSPNGLPMPGQYTCSEDLMKIFEAFVKVPELRRIASTKNYFLKTAARSQTLKNHNKLLGVYAGMGPAKTGWTYVSRHTYAAAASRGGRELHLTLLDTANKWNDATSLFDYGFAHLPPLPNATLPATTTAATFSTTVSPAAISPLPVPLQATPAPVVIPEKSAPTPAPADSPRPLNQTHVIRRGETLTSIAQTYDCSVNQLSHLNQIDDPRSLQVGQKLVIPQKN